MGKKNKLSVNMAYNLIYNLLKMIFPLITFPYATRVLGAAELGKVNFSIAIVGYFALIASLGISSYAIREGVKKREDKKELSEFVSELFTINLISTIAAIILMIIIVFSFQKLRPYFILICIYSSTLIFSLMGIDWINSIFEDFKYISIRNFVFQIISLVLLFAFVKDKNDYIKYIVVMSFSSAGIGVLNFFHIRRYVNITLRFSANTKKHLKPVFILFASSIAVSIYMNLDTVMLGLMKGDVSVGLYTAAVKVNRVVINLVAAANAVLLPRLSLQSNSLKKINIFSFDVFVSLPMGIGMIAVSDYVIRILCGSSFMDATPGMMILSGSLVFSTLNNCISNQFLIPLKYEKVNMIATIVGAVVNLILNLFFIPLFDVVGAAITTLISEMVVFIVFVAFLYKNRITILEKSQAKYLLCSLLFFPISILLKRISAFYVIILFLVIITCCITYLILMIVTKDKVTNVIISRVGNVIKKNKHYDANNN